MFVAALAACGGPSDEPSNGTNNGGTTGNNGSGQAALEVQSTLVSGNPDLITVAANPAGGVFVAGLTNNLRPYLASFDADLQPVWMQILTGVSAPTDLVVDGAGRIVLSAGQQGRGTIVRFGGDGSVIDGVSIEGAEPGQLLLTADQTIVSSGGFGLDDGLNLTFSPEARGEFVTATADGGFVFATAKELNGGTSGTGAVLRKVDSTGAIQWRSYASPGPGRHGMIGVRELADGRFVAAISNDAADSRNVASGSALVTFTFDATGQLESSHNTRFNMTEAAIPLLSGGALEMTTRGDQTFASLIANSGGIGSDARTQVTVELDTSGTPVAIATIGGGSALSPDGDLYLMNFGGRLAVGRELDEFCGDGIGMSPTPFEAQVGYQPAGEAMPQVTNVEVTPLEVTAEPEPLPESTPSTCG